MRHRGHARWGDAIAFDTELFGLDAFGIQSIGIGFFDDIVFTRSEQFELCCRELRAQIVD